MKRTLWLVAGLALVLRCWMACAPLDALDRGFVPDDTYYTLGFARSIAHGMGPTLDGVVWSNGFQPLLAFALVPVFWVAHSADAGLRAALVFGALCDAASVVLLARIAERISGRPAAMICALSWALSPLAIANSLGGLETSLALALELALVLAYVSVRKHEALTLEVPALRAWARLGVLAGLALLARIDALFLVAAICALDLSEYVQRSGRDGRGRCVALLGAGLVLLPWWGYSLVRFGTPIPESGPAALQITALHRARYLTVPTQLGWAAGNALGAPFFDLPSLRELLVGEPRMSVAAFAVVFTALLGTAFCFLFVAQEERPERRALGALVLHALALLVFYALVLPALWFFRRYLAPCQAIFTLLFGVSLARAWRALRDVSAHVALRAGGLAACIFALSLALTGVTEILELVSVAPHRPRDQGLNGAKGYREAARGVLAAVPAGAVLGAFQSGALSYYAPEGVRVVNLDGVVDRGAREAGAQFRLSDYAKERGVTWISDWRFNLRAFAYLSRNARALPRTRWTETSAESQGGDRFSLFQLHWPDVAAGQRNPNRE